MTTNSFKTANDSIPVVKLETSALSEHAGIAMNLTGPGTNDSIKTMKGPDTSGLHSVSLVDTGSQTDIDDAWVKAIMEEERRNGIGRPNPYDYVDGQDIQAMLKDHRALSQNLTDDFDKFDKNSDGLLTPSELEDAFTDKSLSTLERTTAAAMRLAYGQYRDLRFPTVQSNGGFIEKSIVDGLGALYDDDKHDKMFDTWWQGRENSVLDKIRDRGITAHAVMGTLLMYYKLFHADSAFNEPLNTDLVTLVSLPELVNKETNRLPLCGTPKTHGDCALY